jgi:transposase-like protein
MKKQYTPEFKAKVVAETLKEEKSLSEIAAEYGVHPAQVSEWRKMDLEKLPDVFVDERKAAKEKKAQEQKIDRLFSQVGKLTTGGYHRLGYIASWQLDQTLEMPFVLTTVKAALRQARPEIMNSDQGSHFTSEQYTNLLKEAGVRTVWMARTEHWTPAPITWI